MNSPSMSCEISLVFSPTNRISWGNLHFRGVSPTLLDTGRKDTLVLDRRRTLNVLASWQCSRPQSASSRAPSVSSLRMWRGRRCCSRVGWWPASPSCSKSRPSCSVALQQDVLPASCGIIRVKWDFLEDQEITYLASATASTFSSLEKVFVFPTECIFMCFSRYSFLGRVLPQTGQVASTCPLQCNLLCLYKLSIPGKVLSHISHW